VARALFILPFKSISGLLLLFERISPRYLNSATVFTVKFPTLNLAFLLTYMALVFERLISSLFSLQNCTKQSVSLYNSSGEGATKTKSSANESKKIYKDAIV
jgi:hypothetical protein